MGGCCCCGKDNAVHPEPFSLPNPSPSPIRKQSYDKTPSALTVSTDTIPEDPVLLRALKPSISTTDPLKLIDGYLKEPLLPLQQALKPLHGKIYDLPNRIQEALRDCYFPSKHKLTHDESAAIYIYTMTWPNGCLYDKLEEAWNSQNRETMRPWFGYLKLLHEALNKLPNVNQEIWQATRFENKIVEKINSKASVLYTNLGMCLASNEELKDYLRRNGCAKIILIGYKLENAKLIELYGATSSCKYVMSPGTKVGLSESTETSSNGSLILHLTPKKGM